MATTIIIPAAGRGTRMGSPKDGKEMLIVPKEKRPLIDWSIEHATKTADKVVLITSPEKYLLRNHVRMLWPKVVHVTIEPQGEWPDTVLASASEWTERNLLMLPDARFEPVEYIKELPAYIDHVHTFAAFAIQRIKLEEVCKFGIVNASTRETVEKPVIYEPETTHNWGAWGLIAFTPVMGLQLFQTYSKPGTVLQLPRGCVTLYLNWYQDITRTGNLDDYK